VGGEVKIGGSLSRQYSNGNGEAVGEGRKEGSEYGRGDEGVALVWSKLCCFKEACISIAASALQY